MLFILGYWLLPSGLAKDLVFTEPIDNSINLQPYLQIFTDESNQMTWQEVNERAKSGYFTTLTTSKSKEIFKAGNATYWLTFSFNNQTTDTVKYWLNTSVFDSLSLYEFKENLVQIQQKGLLITYIPSQKKRFKTLVEDKYGFALSIPPFNSKTYLLRIKNVIRFESNLANLQLQTYSNREKSIAATIYFLIFNGAFFSILFFLAFFSLFQYFQNKDKAFLFYSIYLSLINCLFWWKFEKANSFINVLFTEIPAYYYHLEIPGSILTYICYLLFIIHFIEAKKETPTFYRIIQISIIAMVAYLFLDRLILYFGGFTFSWEVYFLMRLLCWAIGILAIYLIVKSKIQFAIFLFSGTLMVMFCGLGTFYLTKQMDQHYQNTWDVPLLPIQIGVLIETFLFSVGLGYKSRMVEREKIVIAKNLEQAELKANLQKQNEQQLKRWFTNLTHEFRTPLTVIQGLTQQIQETPTKNLQTRTHLIQSNADNLLQLVNQLLDISKADFKQYKVQNSQQDIIKFLSYLTNSFHSLAIVKKINLSFHAQEAALLMDFDPKVIQTLMTNLIGNALKFTPEHGTIKVVTKSVIAIEATANSIKNKPNFSLVFDKSTAVSASTPFTHFLSIHFSDTGAGIPSKNLPHIFDRFFQADTTDKKITYGTGIGLALVKELMALVGGIIQVESEANKGTQFTLFLPIRHNAPIAEPLILSHSIPTSEIVENTGSFVKQPLITPTNSIVNTSKTEQPLLLIIEDNPDVVYYLKECLFQHYEIIVATNGKEGTTLAFQYIPDIILSDVMMPEMDGYELCAILKNDARTSHIPIILLTAKATTENKHKGLEMGADAYLIKPFDKKELLLRLENLLLLRQQMQLHLQLNNHLRTAKSITNTTVATKEIVFLDQLQTTIQQQLSNEFFKTPQLAKAMAMSQTQLYRKIKALTNQSTAQYLKTIRLTAAKNLLLTTDYSIGQIAVEVGFKTQAHFTRSFQEMFNISPSKIRK